MKKAGKSILFFGGIRENACEGLEQKPNWIQKIAGNYFQTDFDEILSTFSIPVLVIIISILLSYSAHSQETGRLNDYFESPTALEEPQAPVPAPTEPAVGNQAAFSSEPTVRTYQLPSGGTVREYRGEGGMLIRESNWGPSYGLPDQPVQQPIYAQPGPQQPVYAQPGPQQPVYTQSGPQQPVYTQPGPQQPVYTQPIQQQPVYTQPVQQQPVYTQPVQQQPVAQKPVRRQVVLPSTIQLEEELPENELNPEIKNEPEVAQGKPVEETLATPVETELSANETEIPPVESSMDSKEMMLESETEVKTGVELAVAPEAVAENKVEDELPLPNDLVLPNELEVEPETDPIAKIEDATQTTAPSNSEYSLKTWNETGLIPQNWNETEEFESPKETELAQNSLDDLEELPIPKSAELESSKEDLSLSENALAARSESEQNEGKVTEPESGPESGPEPGYEIVEIAESSAPLMATPADLNSTSQEIDQLLYEKAFNTAVSAIKSPSEKLEAPKVTSISESEFEADWESSTTEKTVQQTRHEELLPNSPSAISTIAEDLGLQPQIQEKIQEETQSNEQSAETVPQKIRRLKGKPSGKTASTEKKETKRFQFGVSADALETMISTGEEESEIPVAESSIDLNSQEMSEVASQMNQAPQIAYEKAGTSAKVGDASGKKASKMNLFDFGIEDMEVFNEDGASSSEGKTEAIQPKFSDSASMSTTETEQDFENGEFISPSESTSTISSIYYENCKNRQVIQKVTYESEKSSASSMETKEKSPNAEDSEEEGELDLDLLLLPPDEFEAKSIEEIHEEASAIQGSNDSTSETESVPAFLDTQEEMGASELPPLPELNETESHESSDWDETGEELNILEMEPEDEIQEIPSRQNQEMAEAPDLNSESETQEPTLDQTEIEWRKVESRKASSSAADRVLGIKPSETTEPQTEVSAESRNTESAESRNTESTGSHASETVEPQSTKSVEPLTNESAEEVSNLIAEQIADRIAERVVERTVEEVMKRMKARLDEEAAARTKAEAAVIAEAEIRAKEAALDQITRDVLARQNKVASDSGPVQTTKPAPASELTQTPETAPAPQISEASRPTKLTRPARHVTMDELEENSVPEEVESLDTLLEMSEKPPVMQLAAKGFTENQSESEMSPKEPMLQSPNASVGNPVSGSDFQNESAPVQVPEVSETPQSPAPTVSEAPQIKESPGFVKLGSRNRKKRSITPEPQISESTISESTISESTISESTDSESSTEQKTNPPALAQAPSRVQALPQAPTAETAPSQAQVQTQVSAPAPVSAFEANSAEAPAPVQAPAPVSAFEANSAEAPAPVQAPNPVSAFEANSAEAPAPIPAPNPVSAFEANSAEVPTPEFSKEKEPAPSAPQTEAAGDGENKEKELLIQPCEGVVLNISSQIKQISIADSQFCDYIDLGRNQIALIGKFRGETKVQIEFTDSKIPAMLFHVTVNGTDPNTLTLVNWSHEVENQLNSALGEKSISIFLFQNRIFVKGNPKGMIEPAKLIAAVQKDFVRMKKANPNLVIPGLAGGKHKMVLVNMLTIE